MILLIMKCLFLIFYYLKYGVMLVRSFAIHFNGLAWLISALLF